MPRSPCHFAILYRLHERLRAEDPDVAASAERHLSDFLAGSVAPDAVRHIGGLGKFASHFYREDREETWGDAVPGLFRTHPDLADPEQLPEADRALLVGYVSHLAADEAFRDVVTCQLHGRDDWRPVVEGLWSLVDEIPNGFEELGAYLDRFARGDAVGFIQCEHITGFVEKVRAWADVTGPWEKEQVYHRMVERDEPEEALHAEWLRKRRLAKQVMDAERRDRFVEAAVSSGLDHIRTYLSGGYRP